MAIRLLKLPMLNDSRAVSIQNSMIRARCFFLGCWKSNEILVCGFYRVKPVKLTFITSVATK